MTIRVGEETKQAASKIAEDFGFDLSSVTRSFYRQIVRENRIPLNLSYPEPNAQSRAAIAEADEILATGKSRFAGAEEMFSNLGI